MRWMVARVSVLIIGAVTATTTHGGDLTVRPCALLTSADVGAVAGGSVGSPSESEMVVPDGPSKGETTRMCTWSTGGQGAVSVAVARAPQGAQREAGLARFRQAFQTLKAQGWTEQKKDFSNGMCALMTPPATAKGMPVSTGCFAEAKGIGISVGHNGAAVLPMDKVKTLLDKAIGRLP